MLAEAVATPIRERTPEGVIPTKNGIWLRFLETYRNLCISPSPEFLRTLAWMRDIQAILKPRQASNV